MHSIATTQTNNRIEAMESVLDMSPELQTAQIYLKRMLQDLERAPSVVHFEHLKDNNWVFRTLQPEEFWELAQEVEMRTIPSEARRFFMENLKQVAFLVGSRCAPSINRLVTLRRKFEGLPSEGIIVRSILRGFWEASDLDYIVDTHELQTTIQYEKLLRAQKEREKWLATSLGIFAKLPDLLARMPKLNPITVNTLIDFFSATEQEQLVANEESVSICLQRAANPQQMAKWTGIRLAKFMHVINRLVIHEDFRFLKKVKVNKEHLKSPIHILKLATTLSIWAKLGNLNAVEAIAKRVLDLRQLKQSYVSVEAFIAITINGPDWPKIGKFANNHIELLEATRKEKYPSFIQLTALLGASYRIIGLGRSTPTKLACLIRGAFLEWRGDNYTYQHAMLFGFLIEQDSVDEIFGSTVLDVGLASVSELPTTWPSEFGNWYEAGKQALLAI